MSSRYTKSIPEFIYFVGEGEWIKGPYVTKQSNKNRTVRKFKLVEVIEEDNGKGDSNIRKSNAKTTG